ncbi:hypothetical protein M9458_002556, partial [Cirrhinus mrigala]
GWMEERRTVADATFAELVDAVRSSLQDASGSRASGLPSPAVPSIASPLARPAPFAGEAERCSGFLLQVSLYMEIQASQFPTERAKVAFVISLLADRALSWAEALWNIRHPRLNELATFLEYIKEVFSQTTSCRSVHEQLLQITQSNLSVQEYAIKFRTLAALSNWNSAALVPVFRRGLSPPIQTQMAIFEDSADLETFINRAIRIAQHLPQHTAPSSLSPSPSADFALPAPEPMIMDAYRLNRTERARRITQHLCLYCGAPDHQLTRCPVRPPRPAVSTLHTTPKMTHIPYLTGTISYGSLSVPVKILLDSGASGNFISSYRLAALSISPQRQSPTYHITNIQGKPLGRGLVQFCTPELELKIGVLHSERLSLLVLEEANVDIVLGRPWLVYHQPVIDWEYGEPKRWGSICYNQCLKFPTRPVPSTNPLHLCSTSIESPQHEAATKYPSKYRAFQDVFSKAAATKLPPHRPWDCAIELLPGAPLPKGRVYPLSGPEREAMEKYIKEALNQGFIRPSTSPAASSFFFVAKKDGGLRPCIDYRALNNQIRQFAYPLPLVPAALEALRDARVFSKLDLRSAYNLIRIRRGDEWKTAFITPTGHYEYRVMPYGLSISPSVFQNFMNEIFRDMLHKFVIVYIDDILIYSPDLRTHHHHVTRVLERLRQHRLFLKAEKCEFHTTEVHFLGYFISSAGVRMDQRKVDAVLSWPQPDTIKQLQRFLGFANFYRRFVQGYSLLAAPLTSLLRGKPKKLCWTTEATNAFLAMKEAFCSAPLLRHPNPKSRFVVEVDAATLGVGAVLSQWHGNPPVLHPCAYFSRKLSPAEQNYDVGNRELLAIKLALEEWRHWLEGANHPFEVITDHKNLQYLREAKRLNPRQARWALFFTRFNFTLTYRPGHRNVKADALSRIHSPDPVQDQPEPILPPAVFVAPIQWDLEAQIEDANRQHPAPLGGPEGRLFVPAELRVPLLDWIHTSPGSGHPGSNRTLSLVRQRYWWPQLHQEVARYVQGCSVCATSSTPRKLPEGKLQPLTIPNRPWSHIGVDFATDLPLSEGNTTILVVVDRFSKSVKLIPLKGLPTAFETAQALFLNVFRHFGLPEDIISDRGPQFISRVWRGFFRLLGVNVSLSSGYHPQSNGQTERKIQEVGRYLRAYCQDNQERWCQYLPWAEYAQNSLRQSATGLTPFQCVLGFQPPLFPWNGESCEVPAVDFWFRESERVWDSAHVHLSRAVRRYQRHADARRSQHHQYQPGDLVWLSTRDLRLRQGSKKLSPRYIGPFPVARQINPVTYRLTLPPTYRIAPSFHVSLLKPYTKPVSSPSTEPVAPPPPPEIEPADQIYQIREILISRRRGGRVQYLIDWEGYGPEERSWIPTSFESSTPITLTYLLPGRAVVLAASHGRQEAPVGGGSPLHDHHHQNTEHLCTITRHQLNLITSPYLYSPQTNLR